MQSIVRRLGGLSTLAAALFVVFPALGSDIVIFNSGYTGAPGQDVFWAADQSYRFTTAASPFTKDDVHGKPELRVLTVPAVFPYGPDRRIGAALIVSYIAEFDKHNLFAPIGRVKLISHICIDFGLVSNIFSYRWGIEGVGLGYWGRPRSFRMSAVSIRH